MTDSTTVANLVAKLSLDTSGFTSAASSLNTNSVQKSVQTAVDDIEIDIKHFNLLTEADTIRQSNAELNQTLDMMDSALDVADAVTEEMGKWINTAKDVETAWIGVTKTVTDIPEGVDPDAFFKGLKSEVYQLTTEMPVTFQEAAAAMSAAGQVGVDPENLLLYTEAMLQFESATNGLIDAATATTTFAKFQNVTQGAQEDITKLASSVVALGNNTATDEQHILNMASAIAGAGHIAGFTDAEIMGWSAAMSSVGLEAGRAGTAFSTMLRTMNIAVATGNSNLETFAQVSNLTAEQFQEDFNKDASGTMLRFFTDLGNASEENAAVVYDSLKELGINQSQAIALTEKMATASDTVTDALAISNEAFAENTALVNEAAEANDTLDAKIQMFQNTITAIQGQLGETLLPVIKDIADAFLPILSETSAFIAAHPDLAGVIVGIAGAFTLLGTAAQVASIALMMGELGLAPWLGAVAIIGTLIGLFALMGDSLGEIQKQAEETSEAIAHMDTTTQTVIENGFGQLEIVDIQYDPIEIWDDAIGGYVEFEARWDPILDRFVTKEEDLAKAAEQAGAAISEQANAVTEVADAFIENSAAEQLTETTEETKSAADEAMDLINQMRQNISDLTGNSETLGTSMDESMQQLNELMESEAFKQFANQPVDPAVGESWVAFGDSVSKATEGFDALNDMFSGESVITFPIVPEDALISYERLKEAVTQESIIALQNLLGLVTNKVIETWLLFSTIIQSVADAIARIASLVAGENAVDFSNIIFFQPVSDDVIDSWENFKNVIVSLSTALGSGMTMQTEGEDGATMGLSMENPEEEDGTFMAGLAKALDDLPAKFQAVVSAAAQMSEYFSGSLSDSITALTYLLAVVQIDEEGNIDAGAGNTLHNSLGAVQGVIESISADTLLLVSIWDGALVSAAIKLKDSTAPKICEAFLKMAEAAEILLQKMLFILAAFKEMDKYGLPVSGPSGDSLGGARASGGPVRYGQSYIVGEKGPELFTPNRSGYIIPNDELHTGNSGEPQIVVNVGDVYGESWLKDYIIKTMTGTVRKELRLANQA